MFVVAFAQARRTSCQTHCLLGQSSLGLYWLAGRAPHSPPGLSRHRTSQVHRPKALGSPVEAASRRHDRPLDPHSHAHTSTTFNVYTTKTFLTPCKSSETAKTPSFVVKVQFYICTLAPPHVATPLARRQKVVQAKVIASSATGRRSEGPRKSPPPPPIAKYSLLGIQAHRRQTVGFPRPQRQAESQQKWTVCFFTSHSGSREGRQPGKKLGSSLVNSKSNAVYCLHPPNPSTSFSLPT